MKSRTRSAIAFTRAPVGTALGIAMLLVVAALLAFVLAPRWFAASGSCRENRQPGCLTAEGETRDRRAVTTATLALFAGGIGLFGAAYTARNYELSRRTAAERHALDEASQITERFTRAIDHLGSRQLDIRLGGIYALERIARDSAPDHPQIVEVLTAFIREQSRIRPDKQPAIRRNRSDTVSPTTLDSDTDGHTWPPQLPTDVQAAATVLGRRDASRDVSNTYLDLARTYLAGARLTGSHLAGAQLQDSSLTRAALVDAQLGGADLTRAALGGVDFAGARLELAKLTEAQLDNAVLRRADMRHAALANATLHYVDGQGVDLSYADLTYASMSKSNLEEATMICVNLNSAQLGRASLNQADLREASCRGANFYGATLRHCYLVACDLREADFTDADLDSADLRAADLREAKIGDATFRAALYDDATQWPEGFDPITAGAIYVQSGLDSG